MTRYEYDEEASASLHMDVVHEVTDIPVETATQWVKAMQILNSVNDPLARKVLALHRDCGSGSGPCDPDDEQALEPRRAEWHCETTEVIAEHFGLAYPSV